MIMPQYLRTGSRVVLAQAAARSGARGASAATSSLPLHRYAAQGFSRLVRQYKEPKAPADWAGLLFRRAGRGLPIYVPCTAAALFWPLPVKKAMEARY